MFLVPVVISIAQLEDARTSEKHPFSRLHDNPENLFLFYLKKNIFHLCQQEILFFIPLPPGKNNGT
jgi:hypothetical protein